VINALAPSSLLQRSEIQVLKLSAYAETPGLLGGIFNIIPILGILSLIASLTAYTSSTSHPGTHGNTQG
jgi:hypothetical protein